MTRLEPLDPGEMSDEQLELYRKFTTGVRAAPGTDFALVDDRGRLIGPPAAWVLSPSTGSVLEQLGGQIRFHLGLSPRAREAAILFVAYDEGNPFEIATHVRAGAIAGLTPDDLDALAEGRAPAARSDEERVVFTAVPSLLRERTLSDEEYRSAAAVLGVDGLLDLTALVGYYRLVSIQLNVFGILPAARDAGDSSSAGQR
jgi:4-carboxymuconolactone decarboxylase